MPTQVCTIPSVTLNLTINPSMYFNLELSCHLQPCNTCNLHVTDKSKVFNNQQSQYHSTGIKSLAVVR